MSLRSALSSCALLSAGLLLSGGGLTPAAAQQPIATVLSPVPTPFTTLTAPANPDHFTFVIGGDNRSTGHGHPMPPSLDVICQEIGYLHPNLVLWSGDAIEGYDDTPAEANAEYDTFLRSAAKTGVPFFNAPGNHELGGNPAMIPIYEKRMGRLYGSFDYGNSHFIALNTDPLSADGTKIDDATIDAAQMAWLEADLQANQSAKNRFVFMHHYVFGPVDTDPKLDTGFKTTELRDRLHALFLKYHVRAVLCGHNHRYWHTVKDGIDYYISGGAGAPLDALPTEGGYLHYVQITVDGTNLSSQIFQPWHLSVYYPQGETAGMALVDNSNDFDATAAAIPIRVPLPAAGQTLAVTATVPYKAKVKPATARVVSWKPNADGRTAEVIVSVDAPAHRGTEIRVAPGR